MQIVGIVLAFQTRKVKVKILNDSKWICLPWLAIWTSLKTKLPTRDCLAGWICTTTDSAAGLEKLHQKAMMAKPTAISLAC